jgi:RNA polymerase sigma-70 factor (ECF subfamily)
MQNAQESVAVSGWGASVNVERTIAAVDADDALIARFLAGHHSAFDALFARYSDYVYNIVYGIVGSQDDARDVTQEVFVQVYRSLPGFRRGSRFATWLYRIAVNRAVDCARSAKSRKWLPLLETLKATPDPDANPSLSALKGSERDASQGLLMSVPIQHREVLVLKY